MDESNRDFFDFFEERIRFIKEFCLERIEGLVLISCCIDALSKYRYGGKNSFQRFKNFILEYSGEKKTWVKISLPLLKEHFKKENKNVYAQFMIKLGVNEMSYSLKNYNTDMNIDEIESNAANHNLPPFTVDLKTEIERYEYVRILWTEYRNYAIHEMRSNSKEAPNIFGQTEAIFYNRRIILEEDKPARNIIHIGFPRPFLLRTLQQCSTNFRNYIEINNIELGQ